MPLLHKPINLPEIDLFHQNVPAVLETLSNVYSNRKTETSNTTLHDVCIMKYIANIEVKSGKKYAEMCQNHHRNN